MQGKEVKADAPVGQPGTAVKGGKVSERQHYGVIEYDNKKDFYCRKCGQIWRVSEDKVDKLITEQGCPECKDLDKQIDETEKAIREHEAEEMKKAEERYKKLLDILSLTNIKPGMELNELKVFVHEWQTGLHKWVKADGFVGVSRIADEKVRYFRLIPAKGITWTVCDVDLNNPPYVTILMEGKVRRRIMDFSYDMDRRITIIEQIDA